ncbi:Exopolygalacturonase [Platanthera guangdongensis]|uniref:Exopolygalacturonase n=1 Tax=Platanthera guangdongensis TaxID=2320717 RepID=A0ABR2MF95_9ASPA
MPANIGTYDVKKFGAVGDGRTDDTKAFMRAWEAACGSSDVVKLVIPDEIYFVGPLKFDGPCTNAGSLTVEAQVSSQCSSSFQGTLKATTDLSEYTTPHWVQFGSVKRLNLIGGIFDGQGAASWPLNTCPKEKNCNVLPTNILFMNSVDTAVMGITSVNSKFFHIGILGCTNFRSDSIKISAPEDSPNTDGIHVERSSNVPLSHLTIGTGDDCVSIGPGNSIVTLTNIRCGPGHGIRVGSLGKYEGEGDVTGILIRDSTITRAANGVRIKTWQNSPSPSMVSNVTFDNIIMNRVANPIIIDQEHCPYSKCDSSGPSRVRLSEITFKNIRGTSVNSDAVTLHCSPETPCSNVILEDVNLKYYTGEISDSRMTLTSSCLNVKPTFRRTHEPPPCK